MWKLIFILSYTTIISSCSLFQKPERKFEYPPTWEYDFDVGYFSSIDPILYQNKVIYSGLDEKKNDFSANSTLEAFSKDNGKPIWIWDEGIEQSYGQFNYLGQNYIDDNILHISTGIDYAVNLNDGKTVDYYDEQRFGGQNFSGTQNLIFTDYSNQTGDIAMVKYSRTKKFEWKTLAVYNNSDSMRFGFSEAVFKEDKLIIPYLKWNALKKKLIIGIKTYDLGNLDLLSDQIISNDIFDRFLDYPPLLIDNVIYMSLGGTVAAINAEKADILWQRETIGNSSRSGIMHAEGKLFVNTEFQLYALDAETGNIIWQIDSSAGSRMQHHKGIVYYRSGTALRGVDITTGEVLLEIEAPSRAKDDGAFFQPVLTIDHENDKIYTASYTHAYCYPTLR